MTLLNAPNYNERAEKNKKFALIGGFAAIVVLILVTLAGYLFGHGWAFTNLPPNTRVSNFFSALEAKNYNKAYAIYTNDDDWQQHPAKHKDYPIDRFTDDWTKESPVGGPITGHHVDISRTDGTGTFGTGIIVAVRVNTAVAQDKKIFMWYVRRATAP